MSVPKIGYSFDFQMADFSWGVETANFYLGVDVLFDNRVNVEVCIGSIRNYLKVYMDIDNEKIGLDITKNMYFDRVKIDEYLFIKQARYIEPQYIEVEEGNKIVKEYCQQVKAGKIDMTRVNLSGESSSYSYWITETY